jgi:hypothetical protein
LSGSQVSEFHVVLNDRASIAVGFRMAEDLRRVLGEPDAIWCSRVGDMQPGEVWWRLFVVEAAGHPVLLAIRPREAGDAQTSRNEFDRLPRRVTGTGADTAITVIRRQVPIPDDQGAHVALVCVAADQSSAVHFSALLSAV